MLGDHLDFMAAQLVNSELRTTREYWRTKLGFSNEVVADPRPLFEVLASRSEANAPSPGGR